MTGIPAIISSIIFFGSLMLIFSEKLHRTITAIAGAALMVTLGHVLGFYSEEAALAAIDFNTLGLLLGMMILVAMLEPTGFFQYLAVLAARSSKGKPARHHRSFDVFGQCDNRGAHRPGDHSHL